MISILLLLFLMLYPEEALLCAQKGMQLWLNILIPTLLPFMILTGILIRTDLISQILLPLEPFLSKIFGISPAGACALLFGLLCGYPMGAKVTSDLYTAQKISHREAQYLLTFTNHASPVFINSYLIHTCMKARFQDLWNSAGFRMAHDDCYASGVLQGKYSVGNIRHKKRDILLRLSRSRTGCLYYERF